MICYSERPVGFFHGDITHLKGIRHLLTHLPAVKLCTLKVSRTAAGWQLCRVKWLDRLMSCEPLPGTYATEGLAETAAKAILFPPQPKTLLDD